MKEETDPRPKEQQFCNFGVNTIVDMLSNMPCYNL